MSLKDDQNKIRASEAKKTRSRSRQFTVGGKKFIEGQTRELRDKTKVITRREFFGNYNTGSGTFYATRVSDGKKMKVRPDDFKPAKAGATSFVETEKSGKKRPANRFLNKQNIESNKLAEKIRSGKIKDKAQLRNDPDYKKIQSNDIKNKLIQVLVKQGGDASYKPVEKKVVEKKSAGSFAKDKVANIKPGAIRAPGVSRDSDGVIQIQEKLLVDKKTLDSARRSMSQRAFIQKYPGQKYASGGMVNAKLGAFVEVQNNFSDRMLPNKKRTTRIY